MTTPRRNPSLRDRVKNRGASGRSPFKLLKTYSVAVFAILGVFWCGWLFLLPIPDGAHGPTATPDLKGWSGTSTGGEGIKRSVAVTKRAGTSQLLPPLERVLQRARENQQHCHDIATPEEDAYVEPEIDDIRMENITSARMHSFGVIQALEDWREQQSSYRGTDLTQGAKDPQCVLPPEQECGESQFTVVFMAYNPDRLQALMKQIQKMTSPPFTNIVKEVILVWNGPRDVHESEQGNLLLQYTKNHPVRVVYPLKEGLPNDLMNRYHPDIVKPTTKAIMYYDDDGPFYSYEATQGGFELWKRNANAQIGAMARTIDLDPGRQTAEKKKVVKVNGAPIREGDDRKFLSHCVKDEVAYNYRFFANFGANMVLPSGSFLHANYLCFLWHPAFEPIRIFVRAHPVHPDDITVSVMVSQLAGRSPKVYSRRINMDDKAEQLKKAAMEMSSVRQQRMRRKLLFNINWDKDHNMDDAKEKWARLRSGAINSLVRYFGSINSGSLGWCFNTEYHVEDKSGDDMCHPEMARFGKVPWMNPDHTPRATCP